MRYLGLFLTSVAMALAFVPAVASAPPVLEEFVVDVPNDPICAEHGVPTLSFSVTGLVRVHTQSPHRLIITPASYLDVVYSGNGKTLTSAGPAPIMLTYENGQWRIPGLLGAFTAPGEGLLLLDTGLIVFEGEPFVSDVVVEHGPHQSTGVERDLEAFCNYFKT